MPHAVVDHLPVDIVGGRARGRVVLIPAQPGWYQKRGHGKLVWSTWVIVIISCNYLLELSESSHDRNSVPTPEQVVQASHNKDPHGSLLSLVVNGPGLYEVCQHSTRDGHPVYA